MSKLNIPRGEVDMFTEKIRERKMGELFKHFESWDVQALRREAEEARREAEEDGIHKFLNALKKCHVAAGDAIVQLMEEYQLSAGEAEEKMKLYW